MPGVRQDLKEPTAVKRTRLIWLLPVVLMGLGVGCSRPTSPIVQVSRVEEGDLEGRFVASGRVSGTSIHISPAGWGRIRTVAVKENQSVAKGQPLIYFEDEDQRTHVTTLRSQLEASLARLSEAQKQLTIKRSQTDSNLARAGATESEARWHLKETLSGARQEELRQAQLDVRAAEIEKQRIHTERIRLEELLSEDVAAEVEVERGRAADETALARLNQARERLRLYEKGPRQEQRQVARAQVTRARAEVATARTGYLELDALEQRVRAAEAEIRQLQSQLHETELTLAKMVVRAPQAGIVNQIHAEVGEMARAGEPVMNLVVPGRLWVEANLDEQDAGYVEKGQKVDVKISSRPGERFSGVVDEVSPALERQEGSIRSRTLPCRIKLPTQTKGLKPGLEADVEGSRKIAERSLLIPRSALLRTKGSDAVFVVERGTAHKREIKVRAMTADKVAVASGIAAQATVIVGGLDQLQDGAMVRTEP